MLLSSESSDTDEAYEKARSLALSREGRPGRVREPESLLLAAVLMAEAVVDMFSVEDLKKLVTRWGILGNRPPSARRRRRVLRVK